VTPYVITKAEVSEPGHLRLTFADGTAGDVDLSGLWQSGPVFEPLRDPAYFASVTVDPELGTVTWPNGADLAPEVLYDQVRLQ
jgi:Protein of unknown function (DUF2442)